MAPERMLTVKQAAKALEVSPVTIIRAIHAKRLRAAKQPNGFIIRQSDLTEWVERRRVWNVPLDWDFPKA